MEAAGGINISDTKGNVSLQAGGDIVAGNKTVINNKITQRLAKELTTTPYKFLSSYDVDDHDIFYGRAAVVEELAGEVARHKAIIINGASGSGKSSLVNAGLIPRLADNGYSYVAFREYSDPLEQLTHLGKLLAASPLPRTEIGSDSAAALPQQVADGVASSADRETGVTRAPDLNDPGLLLELIRAVHATPIAVVLDQFERFFINVPTDKRSAFIRAFKHCLEHRSAHEITFVIALREEFFGQLTREFEAQIPVFLNEAPHLNLLPLTKAEAREAIVRPLESAKFNIQYHKPFVDKVLLDSLAAQGDEGAGISPPHLQIVCNELFDAALKRLPQEGSVTIDGDLYKELGGAQTILNTYLDKVVKEVALEPERIPAVRSVLQRMIDTTGTRRFVTKKILKRELPDVNEADLLSFVEKLGDRRVVEERPANEARATAYSVSHEYMVQQVKAWFDQIEMERKRAQETLERGLAEWKNSGALLNRAQVEAVRKWVTDLGPEEQRLLQDSEADYLKREREETASKSFRRRVVRIGTGLAIMVFLIVSSLGVISFRENNLAQAQSRLAFARELAAKAVSRLITDPELSLLLALQAVKTTDVVDQNVSPEAEDALHQAVRVNRLRRTLLVHSGDVLAVAGGRSDMRVATRSREQTEEKEIWITTSKGVKVLRGHKQRVSVAAFSPDGKRVITGSDDGYVKIWYVDTGNELLTIPAHKDAVYAAAFSPDSKLVATGGADNTTHVWDAASGRLLFTCARQGHVLDGLAFSPNGSLLATASGYGEVTVWNLANGEKVRVLSVESNTMGDCHNIAFGPDDSIAVACGINPAKIMNVRNGKDVITLPNEDPGGLDSIAFSPDGRHLAAASFTGGVEVWDISSHQRTLGLYNQTGPVDRIAFSPDGNFVVTDGSSNLAKLWDVSDAQELLALAGTSGGFSPDGKQLITNDTLVDLETGQQVSFLPLAGNARMVTFSPDGHFLLTEDLNGTTTLWDSTTGRQLRTADGKCAALSPKGGLIAMATYDGVEISDLTTGRRITTVNADFLNPEAHGCQKITFSPDGRRFALSGIYDSAPIIDTTSGQTLFALSHDATVNDLAFSPDGKRLATAGADNIAKLWDAGSGRELLTFKGHNSEVYGVAFSPDSKRLVTTSRDTTVKVWDANSGAELFTLSGHTALVQNPVFSLDGRKLATFDVGGTMQLWVMNIHDLMTVARSRVNRPFTTEECKQFLHATECPSMAY